MRAALAGGRPSPPLEDLVWTQDDFDAVAAAQTLAEDRASGAGSPLLVCDTDAFATVLLTGSLDERVSLAVRVTESMLAYRATFGPPIDASGEAGDGARSGAGTRQGER